MLKKGQLSLNEAHEIAKECHSPDEKVIFCCDLGEAWMFKFAPNGDRGFITGHYAFIVEKKHGKVGQIDMLSITRTLESKENLVNMLKQ